MNNLLLDLLVDTFKKNGVMIDNVTIGESKNEYEYFVEFWYNKKLVEYSPKFNDNAQIEAYIRGIFQGMRFIKGVE